MEIKSGAVVSFGSAFAVHVRQCSYRNGTSGGRTCVHHETGCVSLAWAVGVPQLSFHTGDVENSAAAWVMNLGPSAVPS